MADHDRTHDHTAVIPQETLELYLPLAWGIRRLTIMTAYIIFAIWVPYYGLPSKIMVISSAICAAVVLSGHDINPLKFAWKVYRRNIVGYTVHLWWVVISAPGSSQYFIRGGVRSAIVWGDAKVTSPPRAQYYGKIFLNRDTSSPVTSMGRLKDDLPIRICREKYLRGYQRIGDPAGIFHLRLEDASGIINTDAECVFKFLEIHEAQKEHHFGLAQLISTVFTNKIHDSYCALHGQCVWHNRKEG